MAKPKCFADDPLFQLAFVEVFGPTTAREARRRVKLRGKRHAVKRGAAKLFLSLERKARQL